MVGLGEKLGVFELFPPDYSVTHDSLFRLFFLVTFLMLRLGHPMDSIPADIGKILLPHPHLNVLDLTLFTIP